MPITLTCPSCNQPCAVKEEYAGMQVRCPRCPGVITVPAVGAVAQAIMVDEPLTPTATSSPVPPALTSEAAQSFMNNINKFLSANGIAGVNRILLFVGLGCMALFLITVLFPWFQSPFGMGGSALGITMGPGILYFFLTLAALFLVVFVVLLGWSSLFNYSLWTASNLTLFITLNLLLSFRFAAWGLFISFVVMLAAAATLMVVALSRLFSSRV